MSRLHIAARAPSRTLADTSMSDIQTLLAVHELDAEIARLREQAAAVPRAIARLESRVTESERARQAARSAGEARLKERRVKERRVEEIETERRRFEKQLLEVKKNEEYTALLKEIGDRKAEKDAIETQILGLLESEDVAARAVKAADEVLARERTETAREIARLRDELAAVEAEIARRTAAREKTADGLPPDVRARYDRILAQRRDSAIAEVKRDACGACYAQIPPQSVSLIKRGQLLECQTCSRILFWRDAGAAAAIGSSQGDR